MTTAHGEAAIAEAGKASRWPEVVLVFITMLWGGTFLAVQVGLRWSGPFALVAARFGLAALFVACMLRGRLLGFNRRELRAGGVTGCAHFFGYGLQTLGLETIPSSQSAFLTALYVPLVPIVQWLWLRTRPKPIAWVAIALAFCGAVMMSGVSGLQLSFSAGEALPVAGALAIAFEILTISRFAGGCDPVRLAFLQTLVVAALCAPAAWLHGEGMPQLTPGFIAIVGGLAAATAFIQFAMNWAQKTVSATRATLIYAMEPVWAGVVGRFAGERLGPLGLLGAALIVLGIVIGELRWPRRRLETIAR